MAAPQVQTLAQVMAELNPAYAGQTSVIQQRQAGLGAKYDAQRTGITAEKGQGFNAINNQATGRGLSFSGIPIDEQATYLSTKYLPGMQQANYQQNEEDLTLQGQIAQIGTQQANQAFGEVSKQKSDLNSWNSARDAEAAAAREAEIQRQFTASENTKNRAASAAESAANRAASAAQNAPVTLSAGESADAILGAAAAKGDVTSNVFQLARSAYVRAGGNASQFASDYWKYVPKSQQSGDSWKAYYYG